MQGAGGVILGNYISSIAQPDGLTVGMPGRSGFLLAPVTTVGDVKYDLKKLTWIGSLGQHELPAVAAQGAQHPQPRRAAGANTRQLVIGASGATTANGIVPEVLAKYEKFPFKVVRGYPGMNDVILAMERGEVDGVLTHRGSLRADLISSGAFVPVFQTFALEPDLPALERFITNPREKALLGLLIAPLRVGLPMVAPPGLPDNLTRILRQRLLRDGVEQGLSGGGGQARHRRRQRRTPARSSPASSPTTSQQFPPDVLLEYRSFVERQ